MVLRFRMSLAELFITGALLGLIMITLICWLFGLSLALIFRQILLMIYMALVVTFLSRLPMPLASSAAPPACLDGFIVETNGGTGEAYTCTLPAL